MKRVLRGACALLAFLLMMHFSGNILLGSRLGDYTATAVHFSAQMATAGFLPWEMSSSQEAAEEGKTEQSSSGSSSNDAVTVTEGDTASQVVTTELSNAAGAVVAKTISPYTAALHYGNIYIKNSTSKTIDIPALLQAGTPVQCTFSDAPEVLILHTHATESYLLEDRDYYTESDPTRTTDPTKNMIHIGDILAQQLEQAGISVIHDTTQHDAESYTGSYGRAAETIQKYLEQYPSIKVVLDIHRDSVSGDGTDKVKAVTTVNGKTAAQMMLVMGCQDGSVTDFPNWQDNLRLALRYQQALETKYPGLARSLLLKPQRYNENLTSGSMLLEIGTEVNSLEEAEYTASLAGEVLANVLKATQ